MKNSKIVQGKEVSWEIDFLASANVQKWLNKFPHIFLKEVEEMSKFFPRWLLTISKNDGTIITCTHCGNTLVPTKGKIICIACNNTHKLKANTHLAWTGQLPILVSGRTEVLKRIKNKPNPSLPLVEVDDKKYWLVPIVVAYPDKFPLEEAYCYYTTEFFKILGQPKNGSYIHLLGNNRMCLFHYGEWDKITVCKIIQQRVVNHIISTLKIVEGIQPYQAFIEGK